MKTKYIKITLILCLIVNLPIYSQQLEATYKQLFIVKFDTSTLNDIKNMAPDLSPESLNFLNEDIEEENTFTLLYCEGKTLFKPTLPIEDQIKRGPNGISARLSSNSFNEEYYRDYNNNKAFRQKGTLTRMYLINEPLIRPEWEFTNETRKIQNFNCTKATTYRYNRKVVAWYTSEIPITEGPENFWGLPGLIMQVEDGPITYKISNINFNADCDQITPPSKGKPITKKEYDELTNLYTQE